MLIPNKLDILDAFDDWHDETYAGQTPFYNDLKEVWLEAFMRGLRFRKGLYERVSLPSDKPVQFVGVYVLKWNKYNEPTDGFVQVED